MSRKKHRRGRPQRLPAGRPQVTGESPAAPTEAPAAQVHLVSAAVDPDESKWRRLGASRADLPAYTHDRMQALAYQLWLTSLVGQRLIEAVTDHVVGEGITWQSDDEEALAAVEEFWTHPVNQLDLRAEQLVSSLAIHGELLLPASASKFEGRVYLGFVSPRLIDRVVCDPDNCALPIGVVLKGDAGAPGRRLRSILAGDPREYLGAAAQRERERMRDGEAFLFQINKAPDAERGTSDLLAAIDWIDIHERVLFDEAERLRIQGSFIYDVTLKGAGPEAVAQWLAQNGAAPRPSSVRVHNEKEEWKAVSAESAGGTRSPGEMADRIKGHVVSGMGIAQHWAGLLGDANRANAEAEAQPAIKHVTRRQRYIQAMVQRLGDHQLQEARRAGRLGEGAFKAGVRPIFPEISKRDIAKFSSAILQVSQAAMIAENSGWIGGETAGALFAHAVKEMGFEFDPAAEAARVKEGERTDAQAQAGAHLDKVRPLRRAM